MADLPLQTIKPQKTDQQHILLQRIAVGLSQLALLGNGDYDLQPMDYPFTTLKPQKSDQPDMLLRRIAGSVAQIAANGGVLAGAKFKELHHLIGNATENAIFGYMKEDKEVTITEIRILAQTAPVGSDLTVELVDGNDAGTGKTATLTAGSTAESTVLAEPYVVAANAVRKIKVTGIGSGTPGANLTVVLIGTYSSF